MTTDEKTPTPPTEAERLSEPTAWAVASKHDGRWAMALTCGCSSDATGGETYYPGEPLWTANPSDAMTRQTKRAADRMLAGCGFRGVLVPLYDVESPHAR